MQCNHGCLPNFYQGYRPFYPVNRSSYPINRTFCMANQPIKINSVKQEIVNLPELLKPDLEAVRYTVSQNGFICDSSNSNNVPSIPPVVTTNFKGINYVSTTSMKQVQQNFSEVERSGIPNATKIVSKNEGYDYINSFINIIPINIGKRHFIGKRHCIGKEHCESNVHIYPVYYRSDEPRHEEKVPGKTHVKLKHKRVEDASFILLQYLSMDDSPELPPEFIPIEGDKKEQDIWVFTNPKGHKYIINMSFINKDGETTLPVFIRLRNEKELQRSNKNENKEKGSKIQKGYYEKENKIRVITTLLENEKEDISNTLQVFDFDISKLKKEKDIKNNIPNVDQMEFIIDIINAIKNVEDIEIKNSLLILCFNVVYEYIININNIGEGMTENFQNFLKEYNTGCRRRNDVVAFIEDNYLEDNEDHESSQEEKGKLISNNEQYNKRKCPVNNVKPNEKRLKVEVKGGDGSEQSDRNSSKVLFVHN